MRAVSLQFSCHYARLESCGLNRTSTAIQAEARPQPVRRAPSSLHSQRKIHTGYALS